ncbi:MAG: threonylcarbamoyl-AMP synthase [Verrucomicrobia bacterium]|nr:MAG: threonylcarbamoyl-AMP synthase [Verrucomicrobiota bacterium]
MVAATHDRRRRSQTAATERALQLLRKGEIVALPTETVYGLTADALNPIAVAKIFEAKERPRFDPLIVHLPDRGWLDRVTRIRDEDRELIGKLADCFWAGPFTIVLPKKSIVPEIVTAGLDTVAVRISAHPVFTRIIGAFGKPLAAPSANRFGRVSPTTAQHVLDELDGRIPLIIDAGRTSHGIESTILAVHQGKIDILRRGPITAEQLLQFGKIDIVPPAEKISVPGQLPVHYVGLLAWNPVRYEENFLAIRRLSEKQDLREAAANLFRCLRELDELDLDLIVAERVPSRALGAAIMDRLERASGKGD